MTSCGVHTPAGSHAAQAIVPRRSLPREDSWLSSVPREKPLRRLEGLAFLRPSSPLRPGATSRVKPLVPGEEDLPLQFASLAHVRPGNTTLLQAPTPLQYMESGDRYFRHFSIPGVVFDVSSLQNMLEVRIVPASEGRFMCCLKDLLDSVIINFLLPGFQLACPYLAFPGRKVHAEQGFCPDRTQILKEPTGLTI